MPLRPYAQHGTDLMPCPINLVGEALPVLTKAPVEVGRDTEAVLRDVLGYDAQRIATLRATGALG